MKKAIALILLFLVIKIQIFGYPHVYQPMKSHPNNKDVLVCSTEDNYDSNTKVTIYGDSRMEFAEFPFPYGLWGKKISDLTPYVFLGKKILNLTLTSGIGGLDVFLGANPERWNVQNFGISGMTSGTHLARQIDIFGNEIYNSQTPRVQVGIVGLYNHLLNCLRSNGDYPPFPVSYKIARNVAFHIGGNDFIWFGPLITFMPWKFEKVKNLVLNNYEKIISIFLRRKRNILLIGHYPTVATSFYFGKPSDYYDNNDPFKSPPLNLVYNLKLFDLGIEDLRNLLNYRTYNDLTEQEKKTIDIYFLELSKVSEIISSRASLEVSCKLFEGITEIMNQGINGSLLKSDPLKFCKKVLMTSLNNHRIEDMISSLDKKFRVNENKAQQWYLTWLYFTLNEGFPQATIPSLGMLAVELELPEIVERRNRDARNYGVSIHYLRLWEYFLNPYVPNETWVANPLLIADRLHPNVYGFLVWGYHVGNKIRELGWHLDKFDVSKQKEKEEPLLSKPELDSINDSQPLPNENSDRDANYEPSLFDWWLICFLLGRCGR